MSELFAYTFFLLIFIVAFSIGFGVNTRKWYGWAQVLLAFLLGLMMGKDLPAKIVFGILFTVMTVWLGPIAWKRRHR